MFLVGGSNNAQRQAEPRWPNRAAMLAVGGLYAALPSNLLVGGMRWLLPGVIGMLLIPIAIAHRRGNHALNELLAYILNGVVTAAMIFSLGLLIYAVTQ